MQTVTDADRKAAEELREVLADVTGFWHLPGDSGPLCLALARHRERCERELLEKVELLAARKASPPMATMLLAPPTANREVRMRRSVTPRSPEIRVEARQEVAGRAR